MVLIAVLLIIFSITYVIGEINGPVWMYRGLFGSNYFLFIIGGLIGSSGVMILAILLDKCYYRWNFVISQGTILILGLHGNAIYILSAIYFKLGYNPHSISFTLAASLLIMIFFVPVIKVCSNYCPVIIGRKI